ncbi:hypothetical protein D3C87_1573320 [compost metagenome]
MEIEDLTFGHRQAPVQSAVEQAFAGLFQPLPITQAGVGMEAVERHFVQGNRGTEGWQRCCFLTILNAHQVAVVPQQRGQFGGMGAADGVEQRGNSTLTEACLKGLRPVVVPVIEHSNGTQGLQALMMFDRGRGPHAITALHCQLRQQQADRTTGTDHQHIPRGGNRHLVQCLPGGQAGAGQRGGGGVVQRSRHRQYRGGIE